MAFKDLPKLPVPHHELVKHVAANPKTPMAELIAPYRKFEAGLREAYAQERSNPILDDPYLNVLPVFTKDTPEIRTRARDLDAETQEEKDRYIMALPNDKRRPNGSPAVVASLKEFKYNFGVFSESSLAEMDWSNVVAAGSSVVNTLLPVPEEFKKSKRALRQYYHEMFCPASDVDLFLYGLNEEQAIEKIKQIEARVRDAILSETTVVRTKNAITICSQYPTRHIQIVLRVYKSVSEILTGFDIDSSGAAYDGEQVYVTPRALQSYMTQINHIDLSRRSPSYENRLSKYSHRNFEVYWPELNRSRVDPTIYERSFQRTLGLARLLVLERLPTTTAREQYLQKRRQERGRPSVGFRFQRRLRGNIKDFHEDEVADWVDEDEVSNYHTFTVPYGEKFHAKKIEKLCYTKDLLLNAEWNQPKERKVYLHRHPAFFGRVEDVIGDCCGTCPVPATAEEMEIAEKETEIYVSGNVSFRIDDPGRQQIGSFNPLTEDDWTEMAYVGNTARLCQAIVDGDLEHVEDWLSQDGADPNMRDYTGRTPLHLAVISSTVEIVKCLVDHGARITARLADGQTALHLAAARGNCEMVRILLEKSDANEEEEEDKQDQRRRARDAAHKDGAADGATAGTKTDDSSSDEGGESDGELVDYEASDVQSIATGSFVKVGEDSDESKEAGSLDDEKSDPDFYKIDAVAWDSKCSPLHLAILEGHCDVVKVLCQDFGADVLLPVKLDDGLYGDNHRAFLSLVLALALPIRKAVQMAETLLSLGATSSQANTDGVTAFHRYIRSGGQKLIDTLWENDKIGLKAALNHVAVTGTRWSHEASTPLMTAVDRGDPILVLKLLEAGANPEIDFDSWLKGAKLSFTEHLGEHSTNKEYWRRGVEQPLIVAIQSPNPKTAVELLERGAEPNVITKTSSGLLENHWSRRYNKGQSALDLVRDSLEELREYKGEKAKFLMRRDKYIPGYKPLQYFLEPPKGPQETDKFLQKFQRGTYQWWVVSEDIDGRVQDHEREQGHFEREKKELEESEGLPKKKEAIQEAIAQLEEVEKVLQAKGAKTFKELHPDIEGPTNTNDTKDKPPGPYEFKFTFKGATDLTDKREAAYVELFEAAWAGNLDKIKTFTLAPFDEDEPPLKIAVSDSKGNNPFSLALLRGHYAVAKAVLEIAQAQWAPKDKENARYRMAGTEDDSSYELDSDNGDEPDIHKDIIDKQLTIDNVGAVSTQVKSDVLPTQLIKWPAPTFELSSEDGSIKRINSDRQDLVIFAMARNNTEMFRFLIDVSVHYALQTPEAAQEPSPDSDSAAAEANRFYSFSEEQFREACKLGRVDMLAEVIRRAGAGIPFEDLVKKSGLQVQAKPRYYQGLTVYGKKRADWARKGRNLVARPQSGTQAPPLLIAALQGSLDSVEWFCSDTPIRHYQEFGASKVAKEDPRLKHLVQAPGGFDRAIAKWLGVQNDLVIHCAVMGPLGEKTSRLIEYLVKIAPASLEARSPDLGYTPLYLACLLGRVDFASVLIKAGADQSVKDKDFNNLVHAALTNTNNTYNASNRLSPGNDLVKNSKWTTVGAAGKLRKLLDLLDPQLRPELFRQRNQLAHGGDTPLHYWLKRANQSRGDPNNLAYHNDDDDLDSVGFDYDSNDDSSDSNGTCTGRQGRENPVVAADLEILRTILEYSGGAELETLNGAGDTSLHCAVARELPGHVRVILQRDPALLLRENAVGRTPAEVAHDLLAAKRFRDQQGPILVPVRASCTTQRKRIADLPSKNPNTFVHWSRKSHGGIYARRPKTQRELVWDVVEEFLAAARSTGTKRRLVSLNEANDVARRIGESYTGQRYFRKNARDTAGNYNPYATGNGSNSDDDADADENGEKKEKETDFVTPVYNAKKGVAWADDDRVRCSRCGEVHEPEE